MEQQMIEPFDRVTGRMVTGERRSLRIGNIDFSLCSPFEEMFLVLGESDGVELDRVTVTGPGMISLMFALRHDVTLIDTDGNSLTIPANSVAIMDRPKDRLFDVLVQARDFFVLTLHLTPGALRREPFRCALQQVYDGLFDPAGRTGYLLATLPISADLRALALAAAHSCRRQDPDDPLAPSLRTLELVDGIRRLAARETPRRVVPSKGDLDRLFQARSLIDSRFAENLTMSLLASELSMSLSKLADGFRATFGVSPMAYLQAVRIERAKKLLVASDATIGQVAWAVGYGHQCNFASAFKRATGRSPRDFRQQQDRAAS